MGYTHLFDFAFNMNQPNILRPLTDEELSLLLAPVPLERQQRDALVRIALRPGLLADYAGPVKLHDLRLALSPWHWLKQELAASERTAAFCQQVVEARAEGSSLGTVAEQAGWLSNNELLDEGGNAWYSNPGDNYYWGHYGILGEQDDLHFLHPSFELQVVQFFPDESFSEGIVVAQAEWGDCHTMSACWGDNKTTGPAGIFASCNRSDNDWMVNPNEMWLTDSITGETCKLICSDVDEFESSEDWRGVTPWLDDPKSDNTAQGLPAPLTGLRYDAGCLYRADTGALLTLTLTRPEAPVAQFPSPAQ